MKSTQLFLFLIFNIYVSISLGQKPHKNTSHTLAQNQQYQNPSSTQDEVNNPSSDVQIPKDRYSMTDEELKNFKESKIDSKNNQITFVFQSKMTGLAYSKKVEKNIQLGLKYLSINNVKNDSGGNLDTAQYYDSAYGYRGESFGLYLKYYFASEGSKIKGFFIEPSISTVKGNYFYNQTRFDRDPGFFSSLFGLDKRELDSDSISSNESYINSSLSIAYHWPWYSYNFIFDTMDVSLFVSANYNTASNSKVLKTKFLSEKDVADEINSNISFGAEFSILF